MRTRSNQVAHFVLAVLFLVAASPALAAELEGVKIGQKVADNDSLRDLMGNVRPLSDFEGKALVLAFIGVDCPLANLYVPRLVEMYETYAPRDVQFLAVYPNRPETLNDVAAHAYQRGIPFPVLKDFRAQLADALGVTRTPTVCVLDAHGALRYRGRIDDQFAVASRRAAPRHHELQDALDALLAGNEVEKAEVVADGCPLNRSASQIRHESVTYHQHVAPIVRARCV